MRGGWLCLWLAAVVSPPAFAQPQIYWNTVGLPGAHPRVVALAADPRNNSILYLAASGGGIWKSRDGGGSWTPQFDAAASLQVASLALDPRAPDVLYAGTGEDQSLRSGQTVARSADGGQTWAFPARFSSKPVWTLAVDPENSARLCAGSGEGLFCSSDTGASWKKVLASPVTGIAFDGWGSLYAGILEPDARRMSENTLARSSDGGQTWTKLILPPNPEVAQVNWVGLLAQGATLSLVVSYQTNSTIAGGSTSLQAPLSQMDFHRSTDAGNTWSSAFFVGRARPPVSLIADPATQRLFVVGNKILISSNQGLSWQSITTAGSGFHTAVPLGTSLLLGGEEGLERLALSSEDPAPEVAQIPLGQHLGTALDSAGGIWAAGPAGLFGPGPVYYGTTPVKIPGIGPVGNVVASSSSPPTQFATGNNQVYRSTDLGSTFSARTVVTDGELRAPYPPLLIDPGITSTAYLAGRQIYRTTDRGANWTALATVNQDPTHVVTALAMAPTSRSTLYAATGCLPEVANVACAANSLIWRSTNGGTSWTRMGSVAGLVSRLAVDPRLTNTLYAAIGAFPGGPSVSAGLAAGDLLRSSDNGATWASVLGNMPKGPVNTVVMDPTSLPSQLTQPARRIFAGTDTGVYVSFNAGQHWTDLRGVTGWSLPHSPVTDLVLRQPGNTLLAATFGRGVFQADTSRLSPGITAGSFETDVTLTEGTTLTTGLPLINLSTSSALGYQLNPLDPWISFPEPSGTVKQGSTLQVSMRVSAAGLKAGSYRGRVQLVSSSGLQNLFVDAHVTGSPSTLMIVSGNNASGTAGSTLPPLQVKVADSSQVPLAGITVSFTIASGGGTLSQRTVQTNVAGLASTVLTLPATRGTVRVTASTGERSVTFTATSVLAPSLQADTVLDGVTFSAYASFGPGSIISASGKNLAEAGAVADGFALPTVLRTTRLLLTSTAGDMALPLFSVSPLRVKALVPPNITPGAYRLCVEVATIRSNEVQVHVAAFAPGIFTIAENGRGPGVFIKSDGSQVTSANPAARGSTVTLLASGLGAVTPPVEPGRAGASTEPRNRTVADPQVFFDSHQAEVTYSGLAPGGTGYYFVTVRVPAFVSPATNVSVSLTIGGFVSNRVTIPVR